MNFKITYHETNFMGQSFEREQLLTVEPSGDPIAAARLGFWQTFDTTSDISRIEIVDCEPVEEEPEPINEAIEPVHEPAESIFNPIVMT